jgi:hypothetical protein
MEPAVRPRSNGAPLATFILPAGPWPGHAPVGQPMLAILGVTTSCPEVDAARVLRNTCPRSRQASPRLCRVRLVLGAIRGELRTPHGRLPAYSSRRRKIAQPRRPSGTTFVGIRRTTARTRARLKRRCAASRRRRTLGRTGKFVLVLGGSSPECSGMIAYPQELSDPVSGWRVDATMASISPEIPVSRKRVQLPCRT